MLGINFKLVPSTCWSLGNSCQSMGPDCHQVLMPKPQAVIQIQSLCSLLCYLLEVKVITCYLSEPKGSL